ncbi:MAG: nucleotidyltransferase family protein [Thermodesulfobacteriota bacterium]
MTWTAEDTCILKLLFEPGKARTFLFDRKSGARSPANDPDWTRLVATARREGVSGVLFHNITKHRIADLIPPECYRDLSNDYRASLKRNMRVMGRLREVLATFQAGGIPCIVLKGIALAELVYPSLAMRGMTDVDILVKKRDLFKADACLASLGYAPRDSTAEAAIHNPAGYLASLEYRKDAGSPLHLHVHWHTVNTSVPATMFIEGVDIHRLWENAAATDIAGSRAWMLRPEHLIIYLCEHALRVGHSFDRLILVCDIFFAVKAFENVIDWDFTAEESRRFGLSRLIFHGLSIVKHYTSLEIADGCIAKSRPSRISMGEKLFLRLQHSNRRIRGSSYFIYLAMNRRLSDKIRFIARTFFPPASILLQRIHRSDAEFSNVLYLLRIGGICSHVWGSLAHGRGKMSANP